MSTTLTVAELKDELTQGTRPQMIDVRSPSEYATGHIPCTINIPMDQFEARRRDLHLEDGVVLVCKAGSRARIVANWITDGSRVRVLEGGTDAWRHEGLEIVTSSRSRWSLERQVRLGAGLLVLAGTALSVTRFPRAVYLAMFVGAGLIFAGASDICPMGILLSKMPWNQAVEGQAPDSGSACCGR